MINNKKTIFAIVLIMLVQFIASLEMSVMFPLVPVVASVYGVASHQVAYMNIGNSVLGLFASGIGYLSDKTGIKKMLSVTIFIFFLGSLIIALIPGSIPAYVIGRSLTGLAFFTIMGLGLNYLSLLVEEERLGFISGLYRIAFSLGVLMSPFVGLYFTNNYSFHTIYLSLAIVTLVLLILFVLFSPEGSQDLEEISIEQVLTLIKGDKERKMILSTFLLSTPAVFFFNYFSVYLDTKAISVDTISLFYSVAAGGSIIGGLFVMLFSDKIGKFNSIIFTSLLIPVFLIGLYFSKAWLIFALGIGFGFAYDSSTGLLLPVGSMIVDRYTGTFLTILTLTMSLVNVVSNIIAPTLYNLGGYLILVIIMSISIIFSNLLLRKVRD